MRIETPETKSLGVMVGLFLYDRPQAASASVQQWAREIEHKVQNDENHKNVTIPAYFPDRVTLSYYLRSTVSSP